MRRNSPLPTKQERDDSHHTSRAATNKRRRKDGNLVSAQATADFMQILRRDLRQPDKEFGRAHLSNVGVETDRVIGRVGTAKQFATLSRGI